jgi:hypothetical protein
MQKKGEKLEETDEELRDNRYRQRGLGARRYTKWKCLSFIKNNEMCHKKNYKPQYKYTHIGSITYHKEKLTFVLRSWVSSRTDRKV